jgi:Fur family iron response transcriptional regulator
MDTIDDRDLVRDLIRRKLEAHGVTATAQRVDVGCVLFDRPQHLSAEQVIDRLRESNSRVSKATVYNTLNLFTQRGLVRAVTVDPTRIYYDSTSEPHHHFYNADTGELTDIPPGAIEIGRLPELPPDTCADGVHVIVQLRNRAEGES